MNTSSKLLILYCTLKTECCRFTESTITTIRCILMYKRRTNRRIQVKSFILFLTLPLIRKIALMHIKTIATSSCHNVFTPFNIICYCLTETYIFSYIPYIISKVLQYYSESIDYFDDQIFPYISFSFQTVL